MTGRLKDILHQSHQMKVLVVGDLILDEYIWGTVERISPEAPVQILDSISENKVPGGAANVANNLKALHCQVYLCGAVGEDEGGRQLLEILKQKGIHCDGVMINPSGSTTHKTRLIAHSQQVLRIDRENRRPLSDGVLRKAANYLAEIIPQVDGIICSDYQKGFLVDDLLHHMIQCARSANVRVVLDPKGSDYAHYKGADVLTPNFEEIKRAYPIRITKEQDLDQVVQHAFDMTQSRAILVTKGKDGMTLYENKGDTVHIPTEAREVYDVTGAGDTVISVFALGLFRGAGLVDAATLANKAAGIVIGKVGTATVSDEELGRYLDEERLAIPGKIVSVDECKQALSGARNKGQRIVFTNGCFDLLHVGHIQFLQSARKRGDLLVVGLNDDRSVRQIKGPGRPILAEMERAKILAALDCLDYAVFFSEPTPEKLIDALKPDVLVKGGDYRIDQVVGREMVEGYGGRVEIIPLVPGHSTSKIVESIIQRYGRSNPS